MKLYLKNKKYHSDPQFNMTPMIDVVFLLIVFFMLVCQFISQENYRLVVPDDCQTVIKPEDPDPQAIIVNVYLEDVQIVYAVGGKEIRHTDDTEQLTEILTEAIREKNTTKTQPRILLRAHRNLESKNVYPVMQAASNANIGLIKLAAFDQIQAAR
ncbi:MAG: biopolymer transporter ExbD [Phycisphaerae bacterium]|nr:biopolymer transporter ExbD [Phycisphaerae bacterium]